MTRIRHVDCRRTRALTRLRNNYVVLQEIDPDNELLSLATLDDDGWDSHFQMNILKGMLILKARMKGL